MSKKSLFGLLALVLTLSSLLFINGCGKNVMGPSAPQPATSISPPVTDDSQSVATTAPSTETGDAQAACGVKLPGKNPHPGDNNFKKYIWRFREEIPRFLVNFYAHIGHHWYAGFPIRYPFKHMLDSNKLFMFVILRYGIDHMFAEKILDTLAHAWAPGSGTNPGNFPKEVTLLPLKWSHHHGFYGDLYPGWEPHINGIQGFVFDQTNTEGSHVVLATGSALENIYKNEKNITLFNWSYCFTQNTNEQGTVDLWIRNNSDCEFQTTLSANNINLENANLNITISKLDKSANYYVAVRDAQGPKALLRLNFIADGSGGGTLDLRNSSGQVDQYVYVMDARGHGYWTCNGGHKHYFHF